MNTFKLALLLACALAFTASGLSAAESKSPPKLKVINGPAKASLEKVAQIDVPAGYVFLDAKSTRAMLQAEGEPVSGQEVGWLRPTNSDWSVAFEFNDIGYVKDDDKDKLDPDKILASFKRGTAEANKERRRAGNPPIEVIGWEVPPKYDPVTHNLEWAIRGSVEGQPILNYNTRLLGRKGVMEVVLIVEPDKLSATLPTFRELLAGYSFQGGQTYAEYRSGDKVAKIGLAALIAGGAAVGAAKLGLFAWLALFFKKAGKAIVVGIVAVAAFFRKLLGRLFGGRRESGPGQ
jgi:uncharacterized membrane-anchored protein